MVDDPVVAALGALLESDVERGETVRDDGRRLRWVTAGEGPTVVLVAGAGEVALDWAPILPALAERFRVIAYDRAGLGASDRVRPLTIGSQLDDLAALLGVTGPATLVGHSWGGLLAELTAMAHPELVRGLVLVDAYRDESTEELPWRLRAASAAMLRGIVALRAVGLFPRVARPMGAALAAHCTDDERVRALITDAYLASYATVSQVAMIGEENRLSDRGARDIRAFRAAHSVPDVPLRVLTATRDKPPSMQRHYEELAARTASAFRRGSHEVVAESGHYIHHDQPHAVVKAVGDIGVR